MAVRIMAVRVAMNHIRSHVIMCCMVSADSALACVCQTLTYIANRPDKNI